MSFVQTAHCPFVFSIVQPPIFPVPVVGETSFSWGLFLPWPVDGSGLRAAPACRPGYLGGNRDTGSSLPSGPCRPSWVVISAGLLCCLWGFWSQQGGPRGRAPPSCQEPGTKGKSEPSLSTSRISAFHLVPPQVASHPGCRDISLLVPNSQPHLGLSRVSHPAFPTSSPLLTRVEETHWVSRASLEGDLLGPGGGRKDVKSRASRSLPG